MSDTWDHECDAYDQAEAMDWDFSPNPTPPRRGRASSTPKPTRRVQATQEENNERARKLLDKMKKKAPSILVDRMSHWEYYRKNTCTLTAEQFQIERERGDVTGKYLFFCDHREWLKILVTEELNNYGFMVGKISTMPSGDSYCLCLYWIDDSRKWELAERYANSDDNPMKYRFWKSDEDTKAGKYSDTHRRQRGY